jgi:hypothetical protein
LRAGRAAKARAGADFSAHDDIAFLRYTAARPGVAKGAVSLHRKIIATLLRARAWLCSPFLGRLREVVITPLPLSSTIFSLHRGTASRSWSLGGREQS